MRREMIFSRLSVHCNPKFLNLLGMFSIGPLPPPSALKGVDPGLFLSKNKVSCWLLLLSLSPLCFAHL